MDKNLTKDIPDEVALKLIKRRLLKELGVDAENLTLEDVVLQNYELQKQNIILARKVVSLEHSYSYDFVNKVFQVARKGSINLKTKGGKNYQSTLFEILLEHWARDRSNPSRILKGDVISEISGRLQEAWDRDK